MSSLTSFELVHLKKPLDFTSDALLPEFTDEAGTLEPLLKGGNITYLSDAILTVCKQYAEEIISDLEDRPIQVFQTEYDVMINYSTRHVKIYLCLQSKGHNTCTSISCEISFTEARGRNLLGKWKNGKYAL